MRSKYDANGHERFIPHFNGYFDLYGDIKLPRCVRDWGEERHVEWMPGWQWQCPGVLCRRAPARNYAYFEGQQHGHSDSFGNWLMASSNGLMGTQMSSIRASLRYVVLASISVRSACSINVLVWVTYALTHEHLLQCHDIRYTILYTFTVPYNKLCITIILIQIWSNIDSLQFQSTITYYFKSVIYLYKR